MSCFFLKNTSDLNCDKRCLRSISASLYCCNRLRSLLRLSNLWNKSLFISSNPSLSFFILCSLPSALLFSSARDSTLNFISSICFFKDNWAFFDPGRIFLPRLDKMSLRSFPGGASENAKISHSAFRSIASWTYFCKITLFSCFQTFSLAFSSTFSSPLQ